MSLFVYSSNHTALRLYERAGFGKVTTFCSMERTAEMAAENALEAAPAAREGNQ